MPMEFKVSMTLYRLGVGCLSRTVAKLFLMVSTTGDTFFKDFCEFYAKRYHECCNVTETDRNKNMLSKFIPGWVYTVCVVSCPRN